MQNMQSVECEITQIEIVPDTIETEVNHQEINDSDSSISLGSASESSKECVICYESLSSTKNMCITECGHEFCFSCMMKHVQRNNGCPCCRTVIIESVEDSDSEDDEEYDSDEDSNDSGSENEDNDDSENEYPIENFEEAFLAKGYGLKDALSLLFYRYSKTDEKYTSEYIKQLEDDVDELNEELKREHDEREGMGEEDIGEEDAAEEDATEEEPEENVNLIGVEIRNID